MNERIKELAERCYNLPDTPEALYYRKFDKEKFAELIVRECCDIVHSKTDESIRVVMAIEEHFGV